MIDGINDVLVQMFMDGPTWDGNVASKSLRDELIDMGFAVRVGGWTGLTKEGIGLALMHKLADKKEKRANQRAMQFKIVSDNDGHDYVIPVEREEDFDAWLALSSEDEASFEAPEFAVPFEGDLTFSWPIIDEKAVVLTLTDRAIEDRKAGVPILT